MSALINIVANVGNKLDRTLGTVRNKVYEYGTLGGLETEIAKLRTLANKPDVQGTIAAAVVFGSTFGLFFGCVNVAQGIAAKHGYDEDNQCEEGMPGYNQIAGLIIGSTIAVTCLPVTMSTAYTVAYDKARNKEYAN